MKVEQVRERVRLAVDPAYYRRLYELQLHEAGYTPVQAKDIAGMRRRRDGEIGEYPPLTLANPSDGVSSKLFQDSKFNHMSLSMWKPELTFDGYDDLFGIVNKTWFDLAWSEMDFEAKLQEVDTDMPLGLSLACAGIDDQGRANWRRYSPLKVIYDQEVRLPELWRWCLTIDDYDPLDIADMFDLTAKEIEDSSYMVEIVVAPGQSASATLRRKTCRVYRYWQKPSAKYPFGCHCAIVGQMFNTQGIWFNLKQQADGESGGYKRMPSNSSEIGPSCYPMLPVSAFYDGFLPGVMRPVGSAHWEQPIASVMQRIEKAIMDEIETSGTLTFLSGLGLSKETIASLKKNGKFDEDKGKIFVVEHLDDIAKAYFRLQAPPIPADRFTYYNFLGQNLNESSGVSDAQRNQSEGGPPKTAFQVGYEQDAQGIQARFKSARKVAGLTKLVANLRTVAGIGDKFIRDGKPVQWNYGGMKVSQEKFPVNPWLLEKATVGVTEDSLSSLGHNQRAAVALQHHAAFWMGALQSGAVDPSVYYPKMAKVIEGTLDPASWGLYTPEQYQANMQSQQKQSMIHELLLGAGKNQAMGPAEVAILQQLMGVNPNQPQALPQPAAQTS